MTGLEALATIGGVVVVAVFALLLWHADWLDGSLRGLTPDQRVSAIDSTRGRLIQLGAGLLAAGALIFTALNFRLSREGHVTDRYTKAIEQLGSERLDIRLGAIYALERIMVDSTRDHPTVVEVLAAFIREHSPLPPNTGKSAQADDTPLPTDVRAALTVLTRRPPGRREQGRLDLQRTRLTGAQLKRADLTRVRLTGAHLKGADLTGAHLKGADLSGADLEGADLKLADLFTADLNGTNLTGADLTGAILVADLTRANLTGARLWGARLNPAKLNDADLNGADLTGADLTGADLTGARLDGANMTAEQRATAKRLSGDRSQPQSDDR